MRHVLALAALLAIGPAAALAQPKPTALADSIGRRLLAAQADRPQLYVGVQFGLPVYYRDRAIYNERMPGWGLVTGLVGMKLNSRWRVQAGYNRGALSGEDEAPSVGTPGSVNSSPGYYYQYAFDFASVPVQVRYRLRRDPSRVMRLEAVVGLTPQWQRFEDTYVRGFAGQPPLEESSLRQRSTNLHGSLGLTGLWSAGPGLDITLDAAVNQRVVLNGEVPSAPALVPTGALGLRYRFSRGLGRGGY